MTRDNGDDGLAEDLLPLAEKDIGPRIDWRELAETLNAAVAATDPDERARLLEAARNAAKGDRGALSMVQRTIDEIAAR